jgi:hypothetical protein
MVEPVQLALMPGAPIFHVKCLLVRLNREEQREARG